MPISNKELNAVRWVGQEDPNGCVIACLAMITGNTYAEVKAGFPDGEVGVRGVSAVFHGFAYLAEHGFAVAPKFIYYHPLSKTRDVWPVAPFAAVHYCEVLTNQVHAVVMLHDGTVLDPLTPKPKTLADYMKINFIAGVVPVTSAHELQQHSVPVPSGDLISREQCVAILSDARVEGYSDLRELISRVRALPAVSVPVPQENDKYPHRFASSAKSDSCAVCGRGVLNHAWREENK